MQMRKLIMGGLAASLGFGAMAISPALAGDIYVGTQAPAYEPYDGPYAGGYVVREEPRYVEPGYVVEPAPHERVIVREVAAPRVIIREAAPREVYVRDVPVPPAHVGVEVGGFYDDGCRPVERETRSGRIITVGNSCD